MAKAIMMQGTSSNVGKSVLAAALCRIFYRDGHKVVPFKSQNMALNSYVTSDGGEMGRAQVVQAEAAGIEPQVEMNPILLKPTGQASSQVIVLGRPIGNISAREYHLEYATSALDTIQACLDKFNNEYDIIVIEGAGSPAEVNLKARDIANMRVAKMADAPVLLVADIDRGGALASIVGTLALLDPDERERVKGIIINKFRGDISLLQPAIDFLEDYTKIPVLGVVPYFRGLNIQEEDSVALEKAERQVPSGERLDIAVIRLPRISNFTDLDALEAEGVARVRYVEEAGELGKPDLVIIPGTKNTIEDMCWLRRKGIDREIQVLAKNGVPLWGICGGYQMLGREIADPAGVESTLPSISGLGLLDMVTTMEAEKVTRLVTATLCGPGPFLSPLQGLTVQGYEIHMGQSNPVGDQPSFCRIRQRGDETVDVADGLVGGDGLVIGSYLHGIFDNEPLRHHLLNTLRRKKGLPEIDFAGIPSIRERREQDYDRLGEIVRQSLRMDLLYEIVGLPGPARGSGSAPVNGSSVSYEPVVAQGSAGSPGTTGIQGPTDPQVG
ncbi:cobyric acid synthase cobq [Heliomicrobium modesticaldum Ice1]|uniref:Cobyric acid synthase n=1 Tax=Heliobacterium modesticaldum (strain ATCC 51547 / Ice1) TaxID=498761 RepID=B0TIK6_HELMI|nr:cobyric acid synthase [Heliomicrobium modesticaldum]ABZ84947.1 cobyric acid synthase cobq [Heliomicrobium modesticaldum Ice1]